MKDFSRNVFALRPGMILIHDKRNGAFMVGEDLLTTHYWHNGDVPGDDKIFFERGLSLNDAISIAKIAANAAGLEISTEDSNNITVFTLRLPQ